METMLTSHLFPGSRPQLPSALCSQGQHPWSAGLCSQRFVGIVFHLYLEFSHPIMYKKLPPAFSGEKRKAVTLEMKLKRTAQLWLMCVLSTCKGGQTEL